MVEARIAQGALYGMVGEIPPARIDQAGMYVLLSTGVLMRAAQAGLYGLVGITPAVPVPQAGMYALCGAVPCGTRWAQIWTITRTDGEVFRFTSKDTDLEWPTDSGIVYSSCSSLVPSASEAVSEADAASNMDLSGAIGPDGITEEALYSGLFDGARVEAWLVAWEGESPRKMLLRGTFGPLEQSDTGFKVEILGDGAKLMQTPLISLIQPGCRWLGKRFGGFGGPFCGVDLAPLTVTGTIDSAVGLREFTDAARGETAGYFTMGRVTFTSGLNSGISAEIKSHTTGGVFELWPHLAFPILAGDQYSMTPGCTGLHESSGGTNGCEAWDNKPRYGGFLKVPGRDKRSAAAKVR
jgi:uncharacterized phage protein (TIGR02218 family)